MAAGFGKRRGIAAITTIGLAIGLALVLVCGPSSRPRILFVDNRDGYDERLLVDGKIGASDITYDVVWYRTWARADYPDIDSGVWGDGTNIYTCGTANSTLGNKDMVLTKWDAAGNNIWRRAWGGVDQDYGSSVWGDGTSIYTCGETASAGAGSCDLVLVKWDCAGNQLWNSTWGGSDQESGYSVWCDDTSVYTCGRTLTFGAGYFDMVLVKWDTTGHQLWNRTWGGSEYDAASDVWSNGTSIYTCGAFTINNGSLDCRMALIKWDADGNQLWNRTMVGPGYASAKALWCDGSDIYTCGTWGDYIALVKWDAAGSQIWSRLWGRIDPGYSGYNYGSGIWGDGTSIFTCGAAYGGSPGYSAGYDGMVLVKWDAAGNQIWNRTWGGYNPDYGEGVWGDGTYVYMCGETYSFDNGMTYSALVKWGDVPLSITQTPDLNCVEGQTGGFISWIVAGASTGARSYEIYQDGLLVSNGTWEYRTSIIWSVDSLMLGEYSFAIFATDGGNETIQDTVIVTVGKNPVLLTNLIIFGSIVVIGVIAAIALRPNYKKIARRARSMSTKIAGRIRSTRESIAARKVAARAQREIVYQRSKQEPLPQMTTEHPSINASGSCPWCGQAVPRGLEKARFCVYCGRKFKGAPV